MILESLSCFEETSHHKLCIYREINSASNHKKLEENCRLQVRTQPWLTSGLQTGKILMKVKSSHSVMSDSLQPHGL